MDRQKPTQLRTPTGAAGAAEMVPASMGTLLFVAGAGGCAPGSEGGAALAAVLSVGAAGAVAGAVAATGAAEVVGASGASVTASVELDASDT